MFAYLERLIKVFKICVDEKHYLLVILYTVSVRLEGGRNRLHGRLLVNNNGLEGTVCVSNFGKTEAMVVCRMLDYK